MSILYDILIADQLREIPQPQYTRQELLEKYYQDRSKMYSKSTKSDSSSIMSKDSTMSTAQLIKKKFTPSLKTTSTSRQSSCTGKSPGEKQAEKRASRTNPETLATMWALK